MSITHPDKIPPRITQCLRDTVWRARWVFDLPIDLQIPEEFNVEYEPNLLRETVWILSEQFLGLTEPGSRPRIDLLNRFGRTQIQFTLPDELLSVEDLAMPPLGLAFDPAYSHSNIGKLRMALGKVRSLVEPLGGGLTIEKLPSVGTVLTLTLPSQALDEMQSLHGSSHLKAA